MFKRFTNSSEHEFPSYTMATQRPPTPKSPPSLNTLAPPAAHSTSPASAVSPKTIPTLNVAQSPPKASNITPAVSASTVYKLLLFTFLMFTMPLLSYFGSVNLVFSGNATYAGALAAVVANVVLGLYVWVAVLEDEGEGWGAEGPGTGVKKTETKKEQ